MFEVQLFVLLSALVINLSELGFVYLVVSGVCPKAVCMPARCSAAELRAVCMPARCSAAEMHLYFQQHKGPL